MKLNLSVYVAGVVLATVVPACGNTSSYKSENVDGVEWDVTVNKVVEYTDSAGGFSTSDSFTVADTARINAALRETPKCGNITIAWTIPSADGSIWLVAYDDEPLLSERVAVTEVNSMPSYGGNIQVAFAFPDAARWKEITAENIGKRLAITANGQLMNAPQVNTEITSGACSVSIPEDMIHTYLPSLDVAKLK